MTRAALGLALFVLACGEDADETATTTGTGGAGGCVPGELAQTDGSCLPPGVPPEACAEGFVAEAGGCVPTLPPAPCAEGTMALPGETVCREVAPCGTGKWGDDPLDPATTLFVDGDYGGLDSDGSEAKPWTTIQDAIDSAASGDTIAIAAGTYNENPLVQNTLVVRGRCPAMVEVIGVPGVMPAFVIATPGATGTVVKTLAVRGGSAGVAVSGPQQVIVERVWVHDTPDRGIDLEDALGPTEVTVRGSLVERGAGVGIYAAASQVTIEDTVVRDTIPQGVGFVAGHGIQVQALQPGNVTVAIRRSLLERNTDLGILVMGSATTIEGTVVRDTAASTVDGKQGRGLHAQFQMSVGQRSNVTVASSFFAGNKEMAVSVASSDLAIETSVISDTAPRPADGLGGIGLAAIGWPDVGQPTWLAVRQSLVERSHAAGVLIGGAASSFESVWIRDTMAASNGAGRGFNVQSEDEVPRKATATLRGCVIERSREVGFFGSGADVELESVRISDTLVNEVKLWNGLGLTVQAADTTSEPSTLRMRSSLVERSLEGGVFVVGSEASLEQVVVRDTGARMPNNTYGDGVAAIAFPQPASLSMVGLRIERNARAGITNFGSVVSLGGSTLECDPIPLHGEPFGGHTPGFTDLGDNICGCAGETIACKVSTSMLAPPEPPHEPPPFP